MEPEWLVEARRRGLVTERGVNPSTLENAIPGSAVTEKTEKITQTEADSDATGTRPKSRSQKRVTKSGNQIGFLTGNISEKQFTKQVIDLAQLRGWRVIHFRPARVVRGGKEKYETPVAGDGKGLPDLLLVKPRLGVVAAELKVGKNTLSEAQESWLNFLRSSGVPAYLWTPDSWDEIERVLGGNRGRN